MSDLMRQFECGVATDVGKVRSHNEDAFLVSPETGIWAVADGMGGHDSGRFASTTVVDALRRIAALGSVEALLAACQTELEHANRQLLDAARQKPGMVIGTTLAALLIQDGAYLCLWSGDSRIYRVRDAEITQLTRDHTEVAELIAEGVLSEEEAQSWPRRNVVTRAIGVHPHVELETSRGSLAKDDLFVICSDGLTTHVKDADILATVRSNGAQSACDALVALTLARGGHDNVTIAIVRYQRGSGTLLFPGSNATPAR